MQHGLPETFLGFYDLGLKFVSHWISGAGQGTHIGVPLQRGRRLRLALEKLVAADEAADFAD